MPELPKHLEGVSQFFKVEREHGHGHVLPRNDGAIARCMGPPACYRCKLAQDIFDAVVRYNQLETPSLRIVGDGEFAYVEPITKEPT